MQQTPKMHITITTFIPGMTPKAIYDQFGEPLFRALTPPFPRVTLKRFDGCGLHDETHVDMHFFGTHHWESVNTEFSETPEQVLFVDEGRVLPFGMKRWRHCHRIKAVEGGSQISDEIEFGFGNFFLDAFWRVPFYFQFAARPRKYRAFFKA